MTDERYGAHSTWWLVELEAERASADDLAAVLARKVHVRGHCYVDGVAADAVLARHREARR